MMPREQAPILFGALPFNSIFAVALTATPADVLNLEKH
jgi:hypothetical protein